MWLPSANKLWAPGLRPGALAACARVFPFHPEGHTEVKLGRRGLLSPWGRGKVGSALGHGPRPGLRVPSRESLVEVTREGFALWDNELIVPDVWIWGPLPSSPLGADGSEAPPSGGGQRRFSRKVTPTKGLGETTAGHVKADVIAISRKEQEGRGQV